MSDVTGPVDPSKASDRTRAYRLRAKVKKHEEVSPEDAAWLAEYEAAQRQGKDVGASASRRVSYTEEEHAAVGTGSAAETAAAAALAREEGRRFDYLLTAGIDALMKACDMYRQMAATCIERTGQMEAVHMSMLGSVREHYIARVGAEADVMRAQAEAEQQGGSLEQMAAMMMPLLLQRMGVPLPPQSPTVTPKHRVGAGSKSRK